MDCCNIALIQMLVKSGAPTDNMARAAALLAQAKAKGAHCAVLPECFDLGWASEAAKAQTAQQTDEIRAFLCKQAAETGLYLVAGFTEQANGKVYNASLLITGNGNILGRHRKIGLVKGVEDSVYSVGDRLCAYDTPFGRVGIPICADNLMPSVHLGRTLGDMGVKLILSPCAWAVPPEEYGRPYGEEWYEPYRLLADRYGMTVIGVSNVGAVKDGFWKGQLCIGNSIVVAPNHCQNLPYGTDAEAVALYCHRV